MRWDGLFADLEGQADALARAERAAEIDDRTRAEIGRLGIAERLRAAVGLPLRLRLAGELQVTGELRRVGPDWLLLAEDADREALVPLPALVGVRGLARFSATPGTVGVVESRLTLRHAVRGLARDRSAVRVHLTDGATLDGTVDRVGADFLELAAHAAGEARRRHEVRDTELLPMAVVAAIRRSGALQ